MTTSRRVLTTGLLFSLLACGGSNAPEPAAQAGDGTMLSPYLAIADTLAKDTTEGLPELGARVTEAAEGKQAEPGVDAIVSGARRMGAKDIAAARTAFKTMSDGMITWMKAHPETQAGKMVVHCTMAFDGKGALWVQPEGKVMNPYEGAKMLHCGDMLRWSAALPET